VRAIFASIMLTAFVVGASADIVVGNGKVSSETRSLPAFSSISVSGSGILKVHKGTQKVDLTSDSNILPYITTTVSGGELKIGFKPFTSIMGSSKIEYDVTIPDLTGVRLSGSGDAFVDAFSGDAFSGLVSGSGAIKAQLDYASVSFGSSGSGGFDATVVAHNLDIRCSGSGNLNLRGAASRVDIVVSGSADMRARELVASDVKVNISGSGSLEIKASKSLDATLSGSGSVRYWGNPSISKHVSGSGRIKKAGD
jgi:hypothetical protein